MHVILNLLYVTNLWSSLICVIRTFFKESPARGPAGSPRTQGRAGPANVPSASPITSVKKPDPNIKSMNEHFTVLSCVISLKVNPLLQKDLGIYSLIV